MNHKRKMQRYRDTMVVWHSANIFQTVNYTIKTATFTMADSSSLPSNSSLSFTYGITLFNCKVVQVETGCVLPELQCLVIDHKGRIAQIVPDNDNDNDNDDTANSRHCLITASRTSLDCRGGYLVPGFIDCHVHVTAFTASFPLLEQTSPAYVTARAIQTLGEMLRRGFTTVRDAGGADYGLSQAIEEGYVLGPRLLFCGKALSQTGGHGDMRLPGNFAKAISYELGQCCAGLGRVCDGDAEVRRAVRDEVRKGATHIKVMAGGGVSSPTDRITSTQFSLSELKAIVEEASAANIPVMAHAYTPRAILNAVQAGVTSIEHGNLLNDEAAEAMAQAGTYLVPTLVTYEQLAKDGLAQGLRPEMVEKVFDVLEAGKQSIRIAQNAGVTTCFGTDCLADMRRHQLREFVLLQEAGMELDEILRTATAHAANLIGRQGDLGCIQVGAIADLVLVKDNPLDSIRVYEEWETQCLAILKEGQLVRRPQET